ncbi:adipocyte plasma membrane-associated protein-like isoform X2 [Artemia franciscana]|uniref:Strictosidine synthase conserved region domain-containing protein n=2 Tax=Artemia franciscana TaxID=6661 RepID=A0AA88IAM2_ARTSF|nr:hypothetical protein QYM36_008092 [Artemia franciscana]
MFRLLRCLVDPVLVLCLIAVLPGIPPYEKLTSYKLPRPFSASGHLSRNNLLASAQNLFVGEIHGPESVVEVEDPKHGVSEVYTGIQGGAILKIVDGGRKYEVVARTGHCEYKWDAKNCGRPLGLRSDGQGNILIADAYKGILRLDPKSGELVTLVNSSEPIEGRPPALPNSVEMASDGVIYWTDSSIYPLHAGAMALFGQATGRLIRYNPATGENNVLMEDLHFANGIQLSPHEDFVVVAECFRHRLTRYWLKGPKGGTREVFANVPGSPDNLKLSPSGNILAGIVVPRFSEYPWYLDFETLTNNAWLRLIGIRPFALTRMILEMGAEYLPPPLNTFPLWMSYHILSMEPLSLMFGWYGLIVEIDWEGDIIKSWHNPSGTTPGLSEAYFSKDGAMWLASPWNEFLSRIPPKGPMVLLRSEGDVTFDLL